MSARAVLDRVRRFGDSAGRRVAESYVRVGGSPTRWTDVDRAAMVAALDGELKRRGARRRRFVEELERLRAELTGGAS